MAVIRIKTGQNKGQVIEIKDEVITIGRDPGQTIVIQDQGVSRQHSEIFKIGEMHFIRDLQSTNGTFVNDHKITEELLRSGDQVRIGNTILVFEEKAPEQESSHKELEFEKKEEEEAFSPTTVEIKLDKEQEAKQKIKAVGKEVESKNLVTLYEILKIAGGEKSLSVMLDEMVNLAMTSTGADSGYLLTINPQTQKLEIKIAKEAKKGETKLSKTILKRVIQFSRALMTSDALQDDRFATAQSVVFQNIKSVVAAPILSFGKVTGVLYLHKSKPLETFSAEDLELATAVAIQAGMAISSATATDRAKKSLINTIKVLVTALEMHNPKIQGHSERVATACVAIATQMNIPKPVIQKIQLAALLHDIGKICVPPTCPPGMDKLVYKGEHVKAGEKLLAGMEGFQDVIDSVKYHHEKMDGSGFPYGVKGDEIPLAARILCIANDFDNSTNYGGLQGEGLPIKDVLKDMGELSGKEYDENVFKALLICHRNGTLFKPISIFESI